MTAVCRKNVFYFPDYAAAHDYAVANDWPTDRISSYGLGWAIQIKTSGPYVGPTSAGQRRHDALMMDRNIR